MVNNNKPAIFALILLLSLFILFSAIAFAIPNSLTLQGKLTNLAGASQVGTFNFTFRIYDAATNGNLLFSIINQSVATDANGVYDVILNGINLSFADQYYLGIAVGGENESTPRINLTSAPYSFRANTSEALNPNQSFVVRNLSITGNATIGSGSLSTLSISTLGFNLTTIGNVFIGNNLSVGGNSFFVDGLNGRVGIGTTAPQNKLEIIGAVTIAGTLNASSINTTGSAYFAINSGSVGINTTTPNYVLQVQGGANISNTIYTQNNGNVGIGTTAPYNTLTVVGSAGISGSLNASSINTTGSAYFATSSGNVGIGTTAPDQQLTVSHSSTPTFRLERAGSGADWEIFADGTTGYFTIRGGEDGTGSSLSTRMVIVNSNGINSGNVGINDSNPTSKLTVNGTMNIRPGGTSALYVGDGGKVGIGTITPNAKLELNVTSNIAGITTNATINAPVFNTTNNNLTISSAAGSVIIRLG